MTLFDTRNRSARMQVIGDLDYETTNGVVAAVSQLLIEQPTMRHLRLDCSQLTFCDSAGVAGLLQIHRQVSRAGILLHLDNRLPHLDRVLQVTGTLDFLTAPCDMGGRTNDVGPNDISGDSERVDNRGEREA